MLGVSGSRVELMRIARALAEILVVAGPLLSCTELVAPNGGVAIIVSLFVAFVGPMPPGHISSDHRTRWPTGTAFRPRGGRR
jgi:hypothetical protein